MKLNIRIIVDSKHINHNQSLIDEIIKVLTLEKYKEIFISKAYLDY